MAVMAPEASVASEKSSDRLPLVQAIGRLLWHFVAGEAMTTRQAAQLTGYSRRGVSHLLNELSTYWPICQDDCFLWYLDGPFIES